MATFPMASIPATDVRTLRSSVAGQEYLISVALPFHYAEHPEKSYPVIYVLDGTILFGLVTEMVRLMNLCNELPDAIIVGIGYPALDSLAAIYNQWAHLRMRDLLPLADEKVEKRTQDAYPVANHVASGGARHFLQFIHQELMPFIESEYRVDAADRTLLGASWGGLFALYALFHQPQLFQRYVVASPSLWFGNGVTLAYARTYAEQSDSLPVRLYLSNGEREVNDDYRHSYLNPFMSALESPQYVGLTLTQQLIANCTHCAAVAPGFQAGLVAVFA